MATKKVTKKTTESETSGATFNEFGVCIECQGGDPNCHHNNLVQDNTGTYCVLCGLKVA